MGFEFVDADWPMRVSTANFMRYRHGDGLLLTLSRGKFTRQGRRVLIPVGGAPAISDGFRNLIADECGAYDFADGGDMVFRMSASLASLQFLAAQFASVPSPDRERSVAREFQEEVGPEEWDVMSERDAVLAGEVSAGFFMNHTLTRKPGSEGVPTFRFVEVFDGEVFPEAMLALLREANGQRKAVQFVTPEEILRGVSAHGDKISQVSRSLLNPSPDIDPGEVGRIFKEEPVLAD